MKTLRPGPEPQRATWILEKGDSIRNDGDCDLYVQVTPEHRYTVTPAPVQEPTNIGAVVAVGKSRFTRFDCDLPGSESWAPEDSSGWHTWHEIVAKGTVEVLSEGVST
jgi:hypothetical protein